MVVFEYNKARVEISFTPKFTVRSQVEGLQEYLEEMEREVFDPITLTERTVAVRRNEWDAYLYFNDMRLKGADIRFIKVPRYPAQENPEGVIE